MQQSNEIEIIEEVLNQAVKAGLFANLESVTTVWKCWGYIKYKIECQDGSVNNSTDN